MKKHKKIFILIVVLFLLMVSIYIIFLSSRGEDIKKLLPIDENADKWTGQQQLPQGGKSKGISVQGFKSLVFIANEKNQKVNFVNSENNECLCRMTLYANDKELWKSGYVKPGDGYYNIELSETLSEGNYSGTILYEYFKEDGTTLNSARIEFDLKVITEE